MWCWFLFILGVSYLFCSLTPKETINALILEDDARLSVHRHAANVLGYPDLEFNCSVIHRICHTQLAQCAQMLPKAPAQVYRHWHRQQAPL